MAELLKTNNIKLTHFLRFFLSVNQDQFYVYYSFRYFKVWNFFNQAFYKFEAIFSFFVVLFRDTINSKAEPVAVLFQLISFLCFVVPVLLVAAEGVSYLIPFYLLIFGNLI